MSRSKYAWRLFSAYRSHFIILLVAIVVLSVTSIIPPIMSRLIVDDGITRHNMATVVRYGLFTVAAAVGTALLTLWRDYLMTQVGEGLTRDMRTSLVRHLYRVPFSFFVRAKSGDIVNRVYSDIDTINGFAIQMVIVGLSNAIALVTAAVAMFAISWQLTIVAAVLLVTMLFPVRPMTQDLYSIRREAREKRDALSALIQETLSASGVLLLKLFGANSGQSNRVHDAGTSVMHAEIDAQMVQHKFVALLNTLLAVAPAIMWIVGGWFVLYERTSLGTVVAFIGFLGSLYTPASQLLSAPVSFGNALAVFDRIYEYLALEPEEKSLNVGTPFGTPSIGKVRFESVDFSVGDVQILRNVSLEVQAGQFVAIVGRSGAGKSSIGNLIPRLFDCTAGRVLVGGVDVRSYDPEDLRSRISSVPQDVFLFNDTVRSNIAFGKRDAGEDAVIAAARAANIHDFIESLPNRYDTVVGERGYMLSGGERQRIAIARALLNDPLILIFDEATSSLDSHNEAAIQNALLNATRGRTSIVIAHRLATISSADIIYVMDGGVLVESGTHVDLMARNGYYAELFQAQRLQHPVEAIDAAS